MTISPSSRATAIKLPVVCKQEFATVELLLRSNTKTRTVDALILSLAKYEKQLRKLLCFLLFQNPAVTNASFHSFNKVIFDKKNLFPDNTIKAIDDLQVGQSLLGLGSNMNSSLNN